MSTKPEARRRHWRADICIPGLSPGPTRGAATRNIAEPRQAPTVLPRFPSLSAQELFITKLTDYVREPARLWRNEVKRLADDLTGIEDSRHGGPKAMKRRTTSTLCPSKIIDKANLAQERRIFRTVDRKLRKICRLDPCHCPHAWELDGHENIESINCI